MGISDRALEFLFLSVDNLDVCGLVMPIILWEILCLEFSTGVYEGFWHDITVFDLETSDRFLGFLVKNVDFWQFTSASKSFL